jgi:hypothetical protein
VGVHSIIARTAETPADWSNADFFEWALALMGNIRLKYAFISLFFINTWFLFAVLRP